MSKTRHKSKKQTELGSNANQAKNGLMKVLYTRVSTLDQRTDRQKVNEKDFNWIIEDKISGSIPFFERPGGQQLQQLVFEGKVESVWIWSIDRAGRSLIDILQTLKFFSDQKIPVHFISQGLRTLDEDLKENSIAKMVIGILGVLSELTRQQIRESQAQGIALAKARNVYKGRVQNSKESVLKFLSKKKNAKALELLQKGYKSLEVAKIVKLSPTTVGKIKKHGVL